MEEWRYGSTRSYSEHWLGVSGQPHVPTTSTWAKHHWYPLNRRLDGSPVQVWMLWEERIPIATRNWSLAIQHIESTLQLMNGTLHWGCWKSTVLICKIFPYYFGASVVLVSLWWTSFYVIFIVFHIHCIYSGQVGCMCSAWNFLFVTLCKWHANIFAECTLMTKSTFKFRFAAPLLPSWQTLSHISEAYDVL